MAEFYDEWHKQKEDSQRSQTILKWKVMNMVNLVLRNLSEHTEIKRICDIGGGEGRMTHIMSELVSMTAERPHTVVFDISNIACEIGGWAYPHISFIPIDFTKQTDWNIVFTQDVSLPRYDLIIMSDITEHVEDDDFLLKTVSKSCNNAVLKMPLENCFFNSKLFYWLQGKKKPKHLIFGENHYNGHLRGYTFFSAKRLLRKHFEIVDFEVSKTSYFYKSRLRKILSWLPKRLQIAIFGGAFFVLVKPK